MFSVCRERLIFDQKIVLYVFRTKIGYGETSGILLTRRTFSWPEYCNAITRITCLLTDKSYTFSGHKSDVTNVRNIAIFWTFVRRIQFLSGKRIRRFLVKNRTFFFYREGWLRDVVIFLETSMLNVEKDLYTAKFLPLVSITQRWWSRPYTNDVFVFASFPISVNEFMC